ncbi:MAG: hypothetical protein NC085_03590 [Muribaculaceae bacterium]|nr:hypothetical protein [Alistipes senegalensis]MCM1478757.1 hypothetical protein [Muribaculaceae bacterium]
MYTYKRYSDECNRMTDRCEILNALTETVVRKATPEETEYYNKLLEKDKPYREQFQKENHKRYCWEKNDAKHKN